MANLNIDSLLSGQDEQVEWGKKQDLSVTEIQQKVKEYNAQINSNLFMNLVSSNNCSYAITVSSNIAITLTLSALPCCYCSTPLLHNSTRIRFVRMNS